MNKRKNAYTHGCTVFFTNFGSLEKFGLRVKAHASQYFELLDVRYVLIDTSTQVDV